LESLTVRIKSLRGIKVGVEKLLNTMIYVMNKALYNLMGDTSKAISRVSSKYLMDYLISQKITESGEDEIGEEELKRIVIEDLGLCDDYKFYENGEYVVLEIINPVVKESLVQLKRENIPIVLSPDKILMYMLCKIHGYKATFAGVEYDQENNRVIWRCKKL